MTRKDFGTNPTDPAEVITLGFLNASLAGNLITLTPSADLTLPVPSSPVNGELVLIEVWPTADITLTIPGTINLTVGMQSTYSLLTHKSCFLGLRYSTVSGWSLLALTQQV